MTNNENFRDKYTKSGRIGRFLVDHFYGAVEELLHEHVSGVGKVLEIGVGEGFSTQKIRKMFSAAVHFEASEFCPDLVQLAQQRNPDVLVSQESIYKLDRESSSFDLVLCLEVLEHLTEPHLALSELARVSRQYVMVSVPREPLWRALNMIRGKYIGSWGNTPGHLQHWSVREFRELVGTLFMVLEVRTPLPWTILLLQKKT